MTIRTRMAKSARTAKDSRATTGARSPARPDSDGAGSRVGAPVIGAPVTGASVTGASVIGGAAVAAGDGNGEGSSAGSIVVEMATTPGQTWIRPAYAPVITRQDGPRCQRVASMEPSPAAWSASRPASEQAVPARSPRALVSGRSQ